MAFAANTTPLPTDYFADYELLEATDPAPSQGIFIPLASLAGLSAVEANATTGDGREVVRNLVETAVSAQLAAIAADATVAPQNFGVVKSNPVGSGIDTYNQSYQISAVVKASAASVEFPA
ncbi:hypothetical protein [Picosynechococcus sp. PCC 8807]|uniref:hypothetical protein n=1 Tax=Picosynechococcus sp. PCC 8807 TaxID=195248 RepID=UPI0008106EDE|nr:hypothetical protein [Picosynechococcus sp. PCC 8807]ANV92032.1 hypothetical protein AWQ24_14730 [Picosynechococcus sp. PCC 8807]